MAAEKFVFYAEMKGRDHNQFMEPIYQKLREILDTNLITLQWYGSGEFELAQCHTCEGWFQTVVPYSPDGNKIKVACHRCWERVKNEI